ncbi:MULTISPECIES: cysteine--tRNA ligase [unclassified Salinibacterium]|uniref:cysteine--tRNA ligase n=1 Tax=unclassified Salinibacterium TaxID=2632331 RepID=UPI00142086A6|nr:MULTISPECIES: cysteine--tRNA ligase [unclassified Salinibacterium]
MTIRLYDSRAQALRDFEPLEPGKVGMYVCGPTVQSSPHVGHLRSALAYDLWRRWFAYRGYDVTFVRNVTDIDDKVLANASEREPWWAVAYRVELEFTAGYNTIGILPPTYEPRATASIPGMQELIQTLIERGHAYAADDGSGDVYFDVRTWPEYGALTRQKLDEMAESPDAATRGKRDARDFALWKGAKEGEPESATWSSPWGAGRPGWHIECSAMSKRYLGAEFDIHGGGLDLRFPHHENELAQSTAAGDAFARYWVHNGIVMVEGQKMSKSLGNSIFAAEFLALARPIVVRYYLASAHYRSTIDYHPGALEEAEAALDRIAGFLERATRALEAAQIPGPGDGRVPDAFAEALDDDLGVPEALGVLHETVRGGNTALDAGDLGEVAVRREQVLAMTRVLGVDPTAPEWSEQGGSHAELALDALVSKLLSDRAEARAAKDYTAADRIRDELAAAGIAIDDTPAGAHWSLA